MRLIERVWFEGDKAKFILVPLLLPLSVLFFFVSSLRKWLFAKGIQSAYQASVPVIIVGNIGVGGNGKTPVVLALIEFLESQNYRVGVISRGYGGRAPHYPYLLDTNARVEHSGDEPFLIYQRKGIPVCVGADRSASIELLVEQGCNIIVADDGMQHYQLARDIEIAVVDGKRRFGNGLLLPAGPLRELPSRLSSVDYVICNSGQAQGGEIPMSLSAGRIVHLQTGEKLTPKEFLKRYRQVNAVAGIGSPDRFFATLQTLGFELTHTQGFVDHHHYQASELLPLANETTPLLMTEKDAVKCLDFDLAHTWYLTVDAKLPDEFYQSLANKLTEHCS